MVKIQKKHVNLLSRIKNLNYLRAMCLRFFFFCREENPKVKLLCFILHPQAVTLREQEDGLQIINIY
jgi:hypothetical protein